MNKNVEIRKIFGDESGVLQVPMVRAGEVVPLPSETTVKILSLTSDLIMPSPGSSIMLNGGVEFSKDAKINVGKTLFVDKLEKTVGLHDTL